MPTLRLPMHQAMRQENQLAAELQDLVNRYRRGEITKQSLRNQGHRLLDKHYSRVNTSVEHTLKGKGINLALDTHTEHSTILKEAKLDWTRLVRDMQLP